MGDMLDFLYDDFKVKHNLYSPGYHIKVLPSEYIYKNNPEYIIILAWRYHDKIIQKNKKFLINGGKFILPLPKFKIIDKNYLEKKIRLAWIGSGFVGQVAHLSSFSSLPNVEIVALSELREKNWKKKL